MVVHTATWCPSQTTKPRLTRVASDCCEVSLDVLVIAHSLRGQRHASQTGRLIRSVKGWSTDGLCIGNHTSSCDLSITLHREGAPRFSRIDTQNHFLRHSRERG